MAHDLGSGAPPRRRGRGGPRGAAAGARREGYVGGCAVVSRAGVSAGGFLGPAQRTWHGLIEDGVWGRRPWLAALPGGDGGWSLFVSSPRAFHGQSDFHSSLILPFPSLDPKGSALGPLESPSVPWKEALVGFGDGEGLFSVDRRGYYTPVVERSALPKGARAGGASAAGRVAFFGNWALDLGSRRVLWVLPDLEPATALQPSGDGRLVVVDAKGRLVGLVAKSARGKEAAGGGAAGATAAAGVPAPAAAPATPPTGADGLILLDGREVPGAVAWEGGTLLLAGEDGAPRGFPPEEVAIACREGKVLHLGSHGAVLDAWRRPLREGLAAVLLRESGILGGAGRVAAARTLVEEARRWAGTGSAADAAERALSGKAESKGFAKAVQDAEGRIAAARAEARKGFEEGSAWCAARGLAAASSILLSDASDAIPGGPYPEMRLEALVPPEFPWKGKSGGRELWARWAPILAEADAAFVGPDHPALRGTLRPPWDRETIHLRTPEILLSSRVTDPDLVGPLFVRAARTLAALEGLLGRDAVIPVRDHHDLLDVRLHRSRKEYLDENLVGAFPMPWSAGVYSPAAGGSRFHLPDAGDADALGRGLAQVLSHELVHHFLDRRWRGKGRGAASADLKGHWCVEGIARFVEDQMDTPLRTVPRLDDPRAPCVDASARAAEARKGFLPSRLVRMSDRDFGRLGSDPKVEVRLKNTVGAVGLGPRSLFYENAGALAFFLVHRRGPEGRAAFFRYLADHYSGRDAGDGARALGFEGPEALDAAFAEFLRGQ